MASGTQNLPPQIYNKTQNNHITVNNCKLGGGDYSANHLLNNAVVIFI